jgi:hypothetical protein
MRVWCVAGNITVHSEITYKQWYGINPYLHPKHCVLRTYCVCVCVCVCVYIHSFIHACVHTYQNTLVV